MTKWDVLGRGKQQGVQVGDHFYDELAKCMLMVVVEDGQVEMVTSAIQTAAYTGFPGDGRTFVTDVEGPIPCARANPGCNWAAARPGPLPGCR